MTVSLPFFALNIATRRKQGLTYVLTKRTCVSDQLVQLCGTYRWDYFPTTTFIVDVKIIRLDVGQKLLDGGNDARDVILWPPVTEGRIRHH